MTRILAFSDLHADRRAADHLVAAASDADLVIGAGDFCNLRHGLDEVMDWLRGLAGKAVYVPGNAESADELRAATKARVLHGEAAEVAGLRLYGLGYAVPVTPFGSWSCDLSEDEAAAMLAGMLGSDILVSHAPPKGLADVSSRGKSLGSAAVRAAIERAAPRYCLCGHIHDSWGVRGRIGVTEVLNLGPAGVLLEA
jgi:Icc-related predicted phosphoesterase